MLLIGFLGVFLLFFVMLIFFILQIYAHFLFRGIYLYYPPPLQRGLIKRKTNLIFFLEISH